MRFFSWGDLKSFLTCLFIILVLGGCTQRVIERIEQGDAIAEREVDQTFQFVVKRACRAPIDVLNRQLEGDPDKAFGAYLLCPSVREFADTISKGRARYEVRGD